MKIAVVGLGYVGQKAKAEKMKSERLK